MVVSWQNSTGRETELLDSGVLALKRRSSRAGEKGLYARVRHRSGVSRRFGYSLGDLPRLHELGFDGPPVLFTGALSLAVGLVIAGVSFLRSRRFGGISGGSTAFSRSGGGKGWKRVQRSLASVQIALSLALLVSSAVMVTSLVRLSRVDPGFDSAGSLTFRVNPPASTYAEYADAAALHRELRNRFLALPGVSGAEIVGWLPLTEAPGTFRDHVEAVGEPDPVDAPPALINLASPGYFELIGIPVLRGEAFGNPAVPTDSPPVVISSQLASQLFGDRDPVGRRIQLPGFRRFIELPEYTVAGVVGDVAGANLSADLPPGLYLPAILDAGVDPEVTGAYPLTPREASFVIRAEVAPLGLVSSVREIVRAVDPQIPVADLQTLDDIVSAATARLRLVVLLLVLAAAASLCLGATGVYGIVAYSANQRRAEIGVRLALGARPGQVVRMIMAESNHIAWTGLAAGLVAAYFLTRLLAANLYEVSPTEPTAYISMAVLLLAVVSLASWLPARRLSGLKVVEALKSE